MASVTSPSTINLTTTNVADSAYSEWLVGTTYSAGQFVKVSLESDGVTARQPHQEYKSLTSSNTGNYPPTDTTNWELQGTTNRWAMFDDYVSSQTTNATTINITLTVTKADRLFLFNLDADSVQIVCKEADTTPISDETIDLSDSDSGSWSEYFFGDFDFRTVLSYVLSGYFTNMTVQIIITKTGGTAACGHCVVGKAIELGTTEIGASSSIQDYSVKSTNDFGETIFVERAFAKRSDVTLIVDHTQAGSNYDRLQRILSTLRATPVVYDLNNDDSDMTAFIIFGYYRDFSLLTKFETMSYCNLEIEGLI